VPASNGAPDFAKVSETLKQHLTQWPSVEVISLSGQGLVDYKTVVKTMEDARESFPAVMLGGF
jgi:hypothetical protein